MQLGWWSITLLNSKTIIFTSIIAALLIIHHTVCIKNVKKELSFIVTATLIGCFFDWLAIKFNLFSPVNSFTLFPIWLICYWLLFTTSFSMSLSWLKGRWLLISFLGFIMAPLTYLAGEKFGILTFNKDLGYQAYALYGLLWAISYPLLFKVHAVFFQPKITS